MRWLGLSLLALCPLLLASEPDAAEVAARIRDAGIDPEHCYRVRELNFAKEDIRIYLTDGYLAFGEEINGRRYSAVFVAQEDGGDAEILLFPPTRSERLSLARATGSPNLNEHFRTALMLFTDDTAELLLRQIHNAGGPIQSPEMGHTLRDRWNGVLRNLTSSFHTRILYDPLGGAPPERGFFYAAISGDALGNFDVIYDPERREQIVLGRVSYRDNYPFFDIWTSFESRSFRKQARARAPESFQLSDYRLDAVLDTELVLKVHTRVRLTPVVDGLRVAAFTLSPRMQLTAAAVDGRPAQFVQRDTVRENLLRGGEGIFLLVFDAPLERGRAYEVEFRNEGTVIQSAGNNVFYVGSRDNWYPNVMAHFAQYDVTFRYPKGLNLVVAGDVAEEREEGDWNVVRRVLSTPVRVLGFNLGDYERVTLNRDSYRIEVYANKKVEPGLRPPAPPPTVVLTPAWPPTVRPGVRNPVQVDVIAPPAPLPNPAARLRELAQEVAAAFEFMASVFGPPPTRTLTVSPIPGAFGQGFPGLVYLSTVSYLHPNLRPAGARGEFQELFYSDILQAHEIAHQWWGNTVASASDQDAWIMEALANYSALLYLEKRRGPKAVETALSEYRKRLLSKVEADRTLESMGPIVWGPRLVSSTAPDAWRAITYEKGSWIMHMLRRRLGDERFLAMLGELVKRYRQSSLSTEQFRALAAEFTPPGDPDPSLENFFENWVYSTGIPTIKLAYNLRGKAPALRLEIKVTQSGVDEDFSALVPLEVRFRAAKPLTRWVRTDSEPVTLSLTVRQAPQAVLLDPEDSVLAVK